MRSHAQIVRDAKSKEDIAEACNVTVNTVISWVQRNKVPGDHWVQFALRGWASLEELAGLARGEAA